MKFITCILISTAAILTIEAQHTSGVVQYEENVNQHMNLSAERQMYKDRIPEIRTTHKQLIFNGAVGIYQSPPKDDNSGETMRAGRRVHVIHIDKNDKNLIWLNTEEKITLEYIEFFGKEFLVTGKLKNPGWKITPEQKQVGIYLCQKAIFKDSTQILEAWFTPMIPVSMGPDNFGGLPGLILHIDIEEGYRTITATEIDLKQIDMGVLERPSKGEKMNKLDFEALQAEKIKEREQEWNSRRRIWMEGR